MFRTIVKLFGMLLGGVLAAVILAGIAYGAVELLHAVGVIKENPAETMVAYETAKEVGDEVKKLEIDLGAGSLEIKEGEKLKVSTDIEEVATTVENGTLRVKENTKWQLFSWRRGRTVTVEIPKDYQFESVKIEAGAGKIEVEKIVAEELRLDLGAGAVNIKEADAEEMKVDCGVGKVGIGLTREEAAYTFELEKGVGAIRLNGEKVENDKKVGTGERKIRVNGGVGEIEIKTGVGSASTKEGA